MWKKYSKASLLTCIFITPCACIFITPCACRVGRNLIKCQENNKRRFYFWTGHRHGFGKLDPFLFCWMVWLMEQIIASRLDRCLTTDKSHDSSLHTKIQPKPEESRSTSLVTLHQLQWCSQACHHVAKLDFIQVSTFQVVVRSVKRGGKNYIIL